jgi:starch synthase
MLLGFVGRLVEQKGIDIIIEAIEAMTGLPLQLAVLGSGERRFEAALQDAAGTWPGRIAVHIGYSEKLAHQIEAGADAFLMPSRFEPCGLNQMYSMRYGTPPIVRPVGGLADTVIDASEEDIESGEATGYLIPAHSTAGLLHTLRRALADYQQPARWRALQHNGMRRDFSWQRSAGEYLRLYSAALDEA